jgi:hypothetical protein
MDLIANMNILATDCRWTEQRFIAYLQEGQFLNRIRRNFTIEQGKTSYVVVPRGARLRSYGQDESLLSSKAK